MPLPLLYGLLLGASQCVATLLVFAFGLHSSAEKIAGSQRPENILGFILMMVLLGLAHRAAKKASVARGEPEFRVGAACKLAALTALVGGLSAGAFQWLYAAAINPRFCELQREQILKSAAPQLAQLSAEDLAKASQQIDLATSAGARGLIFAINTFLFATLLGIAYALIFRASVRREEAAQKKSAA